ncbi:MAG TPA: ATP-binding protein [Anaerolineae bacterium]|nr:ATP-binding protein [Anaerolineae bacterium]
MSIRLRLTLWYTLVLSAILAAVGFAIYSVFAATLLEDADRQLDETAAQVRAVSRAFNVLGEIRINVPVEADVFRAGGLHLQVIDASGRVIRVSDSLRGYNQPINPAVLSLDLSDLRPVRHDVHTGDVHLRVLTVPIGSPEQIIGYLQIGLQMDSYDESLSQLTRLLLGGWMVGGLLGGVGGAFLARRALRPIDDVTSTARAIAEAGDLGRRIPVSRARDEVGRLAMTFNDMLTRLEALFKAQQRFTADISHELRTPLTTIRGNLDLIRRMRVADDASLDAAQGEIERMTRLVGDLLLLAQADAGLPIRREPVALDAVMYEVFDQMRTIADGVSVGASAEDAVAVMGDADRLKQLMINLVGNAVRYTPAGGSVTLNLKRRDGWAVFSVSDTGLGIPPEHLPHIFERFYRVEKSRSHHEAGVNGASSGAGLGLSIAQWIAQSHGGRIEAESEVGKGTVFTVYLPELRVIRET